MNTTRRSFFKLLAGAAAVATSPSLAMNLANIPTIWADGVHEDTEGLQALLYGEIVEFKNPEITSKMGWCDNILYLGKAVFLTKKTLILDERVSDMCISRLSILCDHSDCPISFVNNNDRKSAGCLHIGELHIHHKRKDYGLVDAREKASVDADYHANHGNVL